MATVAVILQASFAFSATLFILSEVEKIARLRDDDRNPPDN